MQIPIAQRGYRCSPETDRLVAIPASNKAAATVVLDAAEIGLPLTVRSTRGFANSAGEELFILSDVDCNPFCILRMKLRLLAYGHRFKFSPQN